MRKIKIKGNLTIRQAMKKLSQSGAKCLVIIDEKNNLLGTLSDGDLRKAILNGSNIGDSIKNIYQSNPTVLLNEEYIVEDAKKLFTKNKFDLIPIVDKKGKLVDILQWESVFKNGESERNSKLDAPVVIMAGGKGTRLEPFTNILPKPLIPIHEKPVIEHIIECFTQVGVKDFILSVNYKSRIMKAFFDEINPTYNINFIEEEKPLGTAGSLLSLKNQYNKPLLVTNCDIIVKTDYYDLYKFHQKNNYDLTLVASMKNFTIPYGTCELNSKGHLKKMNEKPEYNFLVNTGLYVINPNILKLIPKGKKYDITNLIADSKSKGKKIGVYPIDDNAWIDVGEWSQYRQAVKKL